MRKCNQVNCAYHSTNKGGCQACSHCGTEADIINGTCRNCILCEGQPGASRFDDQTKTQPNPPITLTEGEKKQIATIFANALLRGAKQEIEQEIVSALSKPADTRTKSSKKKKRKVEINVN